jgi:hypothetical protein
VPSSRSYRDFVTESVIAALACAVVLSSAVNVRGTLKSPLAASSGTRT